MSYSQFHQDDYVRIVHGLHERWTPHKKQIEIGKALFSDNIRQIFVQCGRKFGKSETVIYMLWRWAALHPGNSCYYIGPFFKQVKEIVWANHRLQTFGPREWLLDGSAGINNTELRLNFKNGSFIKLDGSDNFDAYRGVQPHFLIYDEYANFRPEFHMAMEPNLAVFNSPLVVIGTPPEVHNHYVDMADEFKRDKSKRFFHGTSYDNPHISKEWLDKKRNELIAKGEEYIWKREYMAEFTKGGKSQIFPMLTKDIIKPKAELLREIQKDKSKLQWYCVCDPGTITCFAVLFAAINPYTKQIYLLDEIYETEKGKTSVKIIGEQMLRMMKELHHRIDDWTVVYDEAEAWFASEMLDAFDLGMVPTRKSQNDKEYGLSLIKDILIQNKAVMSDSCVKLFWEMDLYATDKNGKIPKLNDHGIDTLRYTLSAANYSLNSEDEPEKIEFEPLRSHRISDDFPTLDEWGHDASLFE